MKKNSEKCRKLEKEKNGYKKKRREVICKIRKETRKPEKEKNYKVYKNKKSRKAEY